jgi:protocatechuate 3,4-dioxygenase alpha subunit
MKLVPTASQTVGPYFRIGLQHLCRAAESTTETESFNVHGRVLDANRVPVPDAMLELWHADPVGLYSKDKEIAANSGFAPGFARITTDDAGRFRFTTCRPGAVPFDNHRMQAPHIVVLFFARGLLRHLITRMYFPDQPANETDPVLQSVPEERRGTLIARTQSAGNLEWNIVLQAEDETVFFAW